MLDMIQGTLRPTQRTYNEQVNSVSDELQEVTLISAHVVSLVPAESCRLCCCDHQLVNFLLTVAREPLRA